MFYYWIILDILYKFGVLDVKSFIYEKLIIFFLPLWYSK